MFRKKMRITRIRIKSVYQIYGLERTASHDDIKGVSYGTILSAAFL